MNLRVSDGPPSLRAGVRVGSVAVTILWGTWLLYMGATSGGFEYRGVVLALCAAVIAAGLVTAMSGSRSAWGQGVLLGATISSLVGVLTFWVLMLFLTS